MIFLYDMKEIGFVGVKLFEKEEKKMNVSNMIQDLKPFLANIKEGMIEKVRDLVSVEYRFDNESMVVSINGKEEKICLEDFYSFPYEELCRLSSEGKPIDQSLMVSCFLKQNEKVMAIMDVYTKGYTQDCIPGKPEKIKSFCILRDHDTPKNNWNRTIYLIPYRKETSWLFWNLNNHTESICNSFNNGEIHFVNKDEYLQKIEIAKQSFKELDNKEDYRVILSSEFTADLSPLSGYLYDVEDAKFLILDKEIA